MDRNMVGDFNLLIRSLSTIYWGKMSLCNSEANASELLEIIENSFFVTRIIKWMMNKLLRTICLQNPFSKELIFNARLHNHQNNIWWFIIIIKDNNIYREICMCGCVYIYVCVYICVYIYVCIYICIYIYVCVYIYIYQNHILNII